ncbi:cell envelope integrity protein TolA [Amycolatopsis anabasis]|uniref:cell envelope integrity protein TolA n=1 Tax=Amycolatopsis anabasis TaxID=1840409 RepID=UPI0015D3ECCC|nr:cell envelope integrity protein TolA [Amycolatopsis anabasis]
MTEDNTSGEQQPPEQPRRGSMRFQDAETTTPREPTLAEQRARRKAEAEERDREIAEQQARAEAERKASTKRKVMIGSGVTVGLVGLVASWYLVGMPEEVRAVCTDDKGTVAPDENCDEDYLRSHGATYNPTTGLWVLPLFMGGGQYHYNYGGTGTIGSRVSGGTYERPSNANITTNSGKTVQRGGFGISGKSSTGTGKSGGS